MTNKDQNQVPSNSFQLLMMLFLFTGCTGLLLEQSFEKILATVVGSSVQAGSIVLSLYFVGLSLGSKLYPQFNKKIKNGLVLYGTLEGFVGLYALCLVLFSSQLTAISAEIIISAGEQSSSLFILRILISALWIFPPTICMGATFPAVIHGLSQLQKNGPISSKMSYLYAANLAGAVLASLLGPYYFFSSWGLKHTLLFVVLLQLSIFLMILLRFKKSTQDNLSLTPDSQPEDPPSSEQEGKLSTFILTTAFLSGFIIFSFEVVWIHLIGASIGMSAYAFALMLLCVLLGLGLGSVLVGTISPEKNIIPDWILGTIFLSASFIALLSHQLWDQAGHLILFFGKNASDFYSGELVRFLVAMILIFPSSTILGMIYPSLFRIKDFPHNNAANASSKMSAINAIGSMFGALLCGFIFIEQLGSEWTMRILGAILAIIALYLLLKNLKNISGQKRVFISIGVLALIVLHGVLPSWNQFNLTSGINVYFKQRFNPDASVLLYYKEDSAGGITSIVESQDGNNRTLFTNGKFQGNDTGEIPAQTAFALVPLLYTEARDRTLVIGLGTGVTTHVFDQAQTKHIEVAELSKAIVEASRLHFSHINGAVLDKASTQVFLEDGRNHLLRSNRKYDLISIEITSVWFAGAANLYSQEFYRNVAKKLKKGGIFQQWLQFHHISPKEISSIIATVRDIFPNVRLHKIGGQGILIASDQQLSFKKRSIESLKSIQTPKGLSIDDFLKNDNLENSILLYENEISELYAATIKSDIPLHNDENRFLEYATPRYNLGKENHVLQNMGFLLENFVSPEQRDKRAANMGLKKQ